MRLIDAFSWVLLFSWVVSCSGEVDRLENVDRVDIFFPVKGHAIKYSDSSDRVIDIFKKVLKERVEKRSCATIGEIDFLAKDSIIFLTGFSISDEKNGCQYLMHSDSAWRLTDDASRYLNRIFADLKRNNE